MGNNTMVYVQNTHLASGFTAISNEPLNCGPVTYYGNK
jgi:hypothetical protein